ncbi:OmpH family outer membrane protein [Aequorivita viscosa]|jgi:outer membrane protein|uniref:Periplasmic chaperone for outer membrane proteins Skp n=1 Tax=Aequorivita viscosa TaxID=797419 RepID=A0A1M6AAQ0_9FLAO|nr:OmpH family outer membrane protein [Aequorivita viscosa]SDW13681.1 periplasmic chaperone for outer membrane proteins Skp [Aequorivita viscosa]SHI33530.1 periplasmic chaperone for outer membrane proteins Skp [Aequorivita viscosa]
MKKMKTILLALAIFAGATSFVNAQSKVAHINAQELIEAMPEYKAAQTSLEKVQKTYDTEIKAMLKELDTKAKQYDSEAASKTDEENQKRVMEIQGMQENVQAYRQQALQDLDKKRSDIFKPILEKAQSTIQKVGRAQGYQYVLDSTMGSGIILADGKDLMADVKKDLGI